MIKLNILEQKRSILTLRIRFLAFKKYPISIITPTNKEKYIDNIIQNYLRLDYDNKELIIIINNNSIDITTYKTKISNLNNIRIFKLDESYTLGDCLNFGVSISNYDYIAKMDDDDYYGANFLLDEINAFNYTDAKIVGKATHFMYFENDNSIYLDTPNYTNKYVNAIAGGTLLIKKEVFQTHKFKSISLAEDSTFLYECYNDGIKIYSLNPFNYLYMRHKDINEHTWKVDEISLRNNGIYLGKTLDYKSIIEI